MSLWPTKDVKCFEEKKAAAAAATAEARRKAAEKTVQAAKPGATISLFSLGKSSQEDTKPAAPPEKVSAAPFLEGFMAHQTSAKESA